MNEGTRIMFAAGLFAAAVAAICAAWHDEAKSFPWTLAGVMLFAFGIWLLR